MGVKLESNLRSFLIFIYGKFNELFLWTKVGLNSWFGFFWSVMLTIIECLFKFKLSGSISVLKYPFYKELLFLLICDWFWFVSNLVVTWFGRMKFHLLFIRNEFDRLFGKSKLYLEQLFSRFTFWIYTFSVGNYLESVLSYKLLYIYSYF